MKSGYATVKAKLSLAVFDLPAKAAVLNCKQFNGNYGCSVCLNPGFQQGRCRVYLPRKYCMRTHKSIVSSSQKAIQDGRPHKGVKGISPLAPCIDLVDSIPVDYMHAVLEGAV